MNKVTNRDSFLALKVSILALQLNPFSERYSKLSHFQLISNTLRVSNITKFSQPLKNDLLVQPITL